MNDKIIKSWVMPSDIAEMLYKSAGLENSDNITELTDAIYYLMACAQNSYNSDYFRTLYNTLIIITEKGDEK